MSSKPPSQPPTRAELYTKAVRHLSRRCPVLKALTARIGPCTWAPAVDDPFTMLIRSVISQQISTKAAKSIFERLSTAAGGLPFTRERLAAFTDAEFKACGVSGPKQRAIRAVAAHVEAYPDLLPGIADRDEAELRPQLLAIKGIGPWTVDMLLMFAICKPDILPVSDYGLRVGVKKLFGLAELPKAAELTKIGEPWRPYRSIATWYIWRSLEPVGKDEEPVAE